MSAQQMLLEGATSAGAAFDFYISPTGSDANLGTSPAQAWAITALNTKQSTYAGKRVGLIAGIYPVFSLWQAAPDGTTGQNPPTPALNVMGGPNPSTMTYIASCDSSGNYSPRVAQITASPSGTPGGGLPGTASNSKAIIGQGSTSPTNGMGNVHFDGLKVSDSNGYCFVVRGSSAHAFIIENCEIYNVGGSEGNNPGGMSLNDNVGSIVRNNKIHDVFEETYQFGWHNCPGIFAFGCLNNLYAYNTIYNCQSGIYDKDSNNGNNTIVYNYVEMRYVNGQFAYRGAGEVAGQTKTIHHNIFILGNLGSLSTCLDGINDAGGGAAATPFGSLQFYSNTIYPSGAFSDGVEWKAQGTAVSPTASASLWNNLWATATPSQYSTLILGANAGALGTLDYNGYFGTTTPNFQLGTGAVISTLAAWRTASGKEAHSFNSGSNAGLFVNPGVLQTPSGYQLVPTTSPAIGKGSTTGLSSGAVCDLGAFGYDPATGLPNPTVGCNF